MYETLSTTRCYRSSPAIPKNKIASVNFATLHKQSHSSKIGKHIHFRKTLLAHKFYSQYPPWSGFLPLVFCFHLLITYLKHFFQVISLTRIQTFKVCLAGKSICILPNWISVTYSKTLGFVLTFAMLRWFILLLGLVVTCHCFTDPPFPIGTPQVSIITLILWTVYTTSLMD